MEFTGKKCDIIPDRMSSRNPKTNLIIPLKTWNFQDKSQNIYFKIKKNRRAEKKKFCNKIRKNLQKKL